MGKDVLEICGLCRQYKKLERSHLLSKALYKMLGLGFENKGKVSFLNSNNSFVNLGHQITKYYLCDDCEAILDKYGENKVIKELYRNDELEPAFTLREKLNTEQNVSVSHDCSTRYFFPSKGISSVDVKAYIHFIVGLFWRASSTEWPDESMNKYLHALGERNEEKFRRYLLEDDEKYIEGVQILVFVDSNKYSLPWIKSFEYHKRKGIHFHDLWLPGICVYMTVGWKTLFSDCCLKIPDDHIIFIEVDLQRGRTFEEVISRILLAKKENFVCSPL